MDEALRRTIVGVWGHLPDGCSYKPASEDQLQDFEREFGAIPDDYRWFLAACGGGVCGTEWVDSIEQLPETHRKFRAESEPGGWTMRGVFVIGWDGAGNPFGIELSTGRVVVEDHNFGGIHEVAESFEVLLARGLRLPAKHRESQ